MDLTGADGLLMALSTATGALLTQFFNYLRNRRRDDLEYEAAEDDKIIAGYQLTIARLDDRIETLEKAYAEMRKEHVDCIVIQGELRGEIAALHKQLGNNPNATLASQKPPPVAPPPHHNSPQVTPHNFQYPSVPQHGGVPGRSIEPLDQK